MTDDIPPTIRPRDSAGRRLRVALTAAALAATVVAMAIAPPPADAATGVGVIPDTATPEVLASGDRSRVELGLTFSPSTSGTLSGVQFYQNASNSGVTSASVWSSTGVRLARVDVDRWGSVGWRTIPVNVELQAGNTYTVSVYDSNSDFPVTSQVFTQAKTVNGIRTPANAGVYRYGSTSAFPSAGADGHSFLVDVVFTSAAPAPAPAPTASVPPSPGPDDDTSIPSGSIYGPDGTHWPQSTPRADAARVVNVAASWSAISAAITANAASTDPVVICVAPGTIAGGSGAGSSSRGVLQNVGNAGRASRILVTPCEGTGTVQVAAGPGVAFVGVKGVSIVGIDLSAQSVMIRNSESFAIGYSEVPRLLVTANGGNGVHDVEIVEIVAGPEAVHGVSDDRVEVKSADGYDVDTLRFAGFYGAPRYKPSGSSGHTDTLQFVTTSGDGTISNVTIEDSVLFQSADQGIMAGSNVGGAITHSAFFGGTTGQLRYPMYDGGDPITLANMLHGTWSAVTMTDAVVAGSISSSFTFAGVVDSLSLAGARGFAPLGTLTLSDIDRLAPMPTPARLASIWD